MNKFNFSNLGLNNLSGVSGLDIMLKIGFLVADLFAIIFLLVVLKQIMSMDHIIHDSNDFTFIKSITFLLILIAISLFIICLVIL